MHKREECILAKYSYSSQNQRSLGEGTNHQAQVAFLLPSLSLPCEALVTLYNVEVLLW